MRGVAVCVASCGWLACATPADPTTTSSAITQGTAAQDPAVVGIVDDAGVLGCSGTLIGPHTVLTAGHCVPSRGWRELRVFFGDALGGAGTYIAVSDTLVHPQLDPGSLAHDLALLTLREAGPVPPLPLDPRTLDASLVGTTVRTVGFGVTIPTTGDSGTKRSGTSSVSAVVLLELTVTPAPSLPCLGDSGGPVLLGAGPIAVISRGDADCVANGIFERVDAARDSFILPYLAATAGGTAATGDPCFYDGHCAEGTCRQATDDLLLSFCTRPCDGEGDCPSAMTCTSHECRYPMPSPGALGSSCAADRACTSDDCYRPDDDDGTCTRSCFGDPHSCPAGFACTAVDTLVNLCLPADDGCGCRSSTSGGGGILVVLVALRLRRRQRRLLRLGL